MTHSGTAGKMSLAHRIQPRDKAAVESTIGAIQRSFFQEVRNEVFYSISQLNQAFREYLTRLNGQIMKDYGVSRQDKFSEEKQYRNPLPHTSFELREWKQAKVHPDAMIQIQKNFYSVPYKDIGQIVRVRVGRGLIEVFTQALGLICSHPKEKKSIGKKIIVDAHYPDEKNQLTRFDIRKAQAQARAVGPFLCSS